MGTRETKVRLDGWCEGDLGQQRNDCRGCASMRESSEREESNRMCSTRPFLLGSLIFRTALPCSGGHHLERGGMSLHGAVGINCENGATTENQGADVRYIG